MYFLWLFLRVDLRLGAGVACDAAPLLLTANVPLSDRPTDPSRNFSSSTVAPIMYV